MWSDRRQRRWLLWGLLAGTFLLVNIYRLSTAVIAEDLMAAFRASGTQLGIIHAAFFAVYAAMQVPTGILVDRVGPRRTAAVGAVVMHLGALWFTIAVGFWSAIGGRFLIGLGGSVIFVSMLRFAASWFDAGEFSYVNGVCFAVGGVGGILATTPFAIAVEVAGWQSTVRGLAVVGLGLAVLTVVFVRDTPEAAGLEPPRRRESVGVTLAELRALLGRALWDRHLWVIGVLLFCANGVHLTLFGLWGIPYVAQTYQTSVEFASLFTLFGNVGAVAGPPAIGWAAGRTGARASIVVAGGACYTASLAILALVSRPPLIVVGLVFLFVGFLFGSFVVTYPFVKERYPLRASGLMLGTINGAGFVGAAIFPTAMGWILDAFWTGEMVAGARVYTDLGYRVAFGLAALAGLTTFVCGVWLLRAEGRD